VQKDLVFDRKLLLITMEGVLGSYYPISYMFLKYLNFLSFFETDLELLLEVLERAGILLELLLSTPEGAGIFLQFQLTLYL